MVDETEIHKRRTLRLNGFDDSQPGAYFVTLVTARREPVFGEVTDGVVKLSALGQIVLDEWMRSIGIRKEIQLYKNEFVVMPNHLHGIVWMVGITVGAYGIRPGIHRSVHHENGVKEVDISQPSIQSFQRPQRSLGAFIAGYKSEVTSRARRELKVNEIWQRNYFDHFIRNETEFKTIWRYINDNPRQWDQDSLSPKALSA